MQDYANALENLLITDIDDSYEGTGVNDRILGHMYHLKQYSKAAELEYDKLKKELEVPQPNETQVFKSDGKFDAVVQPRAGRRSVDQGLVLEELASLVYDLQNVGGEPITRPEARRKATELLEKCIKETKPSYAVSIVRSAGE